MGKAEEHSHKIRAAIQAARAEGVNVLLDWEEDEDGVHVSLSTFCIWRGEDGFMGRTEGPFLVEGY